MSRDLSTEAGRADEGARPGDSRIRVVMLLPSLATGGAERDVVRVAPRLDPARFAVTVALFSEEGELAEELGRAGTDVLARTVSDVRPRELTGAHRSGVRGALALGARVPAVVSWTGRVLRERDADIVHFFLPHSYAYGMVACRLYAPRVRTVMSRLSLNYYAATSPAFARFERSLHRRVDRAVGNTAAILEELEEEGVPRERLRLIHNGLDTASFARSDEARRVWRKWLGAGDGTLVLLAVGNLHEHKGHADLLAALQNAAASLPADWRVAIAGRDIDGRLAVLQRDAAQRGLAEHVQFLGEVGDVAGLLSAGDLFVHPSHHEGVPNAVLEAMSASLPVVATDVGGIPDAVIAEEHGRTGWLVPPHDMRALSEAIAAAVVDHEALRRVGRTALERVSSHFALAACVAEYEALYDELAAL